MQDQFYKLFIALCAVRQPLNMLNRKIAKMVLSKV